MLKHNASTYFLLIKHKYKMAAKAKANTRHPIEIRAAGNPSKLLSESVTGSGSIPFDPGKPPGKSGYGAWMLEA